MCAASAVFWATASAQNWRETWPNVALALAAVGVTLAFPRWALTLSVPFVFLIFGVSLRAARLQALRTSALESDALPDGP